MLGVNRPGRPRVSISVDVKAAELWKSGAPLREISSATGTPLAWLAMESVTRSFWAPRRREGRFIVFGGCGFWLLLWWLVAAWCVVKLAVWLVVIAALAVVLAASLPWHLRQARAVR